MGLVELPGAPWLEGGTAMLLVGSLAYSSKTRGSFAETTDQAHLFDAIDGTCAALGGLTRRWRFDRTGVEQRRMPSWTPASPKSR